MNRYILRKISKFQHGRFCRPAKYDNIWNSFRGDCIELATQIGQFWTTVSISAAMKHPKDVPCVPEIWSGKYGLASYSAINHFLWPPRSRMPEIKNPWLHAICTKAVHKSSAHFEFLEDEVFTDLNEQLAILQISCTLIALLCNLHNNNNNLTSRYVNSSMQGARPLSNTQSLSPHESTSQMDLKWFSHSKGSPMFPTYTYIYAYTFIQHQKSWKRIRGAKQITGAQKQTTEHW